MPAPAAAPSLGRLTLAETVAACGGPPDALVRQQVLDRLDRHCRAFIRSQLRDPSRQIDHGSCRRRPR